MTACGIIRRNGRIDKSDPYTSERCRAGQTIEVIPLEVKDDSLKKLFYEVDEGTLRRKGLCPRKVSDWTIKLADGKVPDGFLSLADFEEHVLEIIRNYK